MSFLDPFKKINTFQRQTVSSPEEIYFQILSDEHGAYLEVVDKKGKRVEPDYRSYSGSTRQLLRSLEYIRERSAFMISWERVAERIYFAEHGFLIDLLRLCDHIWDADRKPIRVATEIGKLLVDILSAEDTQDERYQVKISLQLSEQQFTQLQVLNEETILTNGQLIQVASMGTGFAHLHHFQNAVFPTQDLTLFLSLLFSQLDQIDVRFKDYELLRSKESIHARPCLIFEKVDIDDSLFLRVAQSLPEINPDALELVDLYRFAELHELDRKIIVKPIQQLSTEELVSRVDKLLYKHRSRKNKAEREEVVKEDNLFIIPKEVAGNFIYNELPGLLLTYQVMGAERLKEYKISAKPPKISLSLEHDIDFFEGEVNLDFDGEQINLFDAIHQFRKNNYILLSNGDHALVNEQYIRKLERIFKKKGKSKEAQVSFFDLPLVEELIEEKVSGEVFKQSRSFYEGLNELSQKSIRVTAIQATLRPYQREGVKWLRYLQEHQLGGCLADDMGLGKTLQTLSLLAGFYPKTDKPSLIVMPRSLLFNWKNEVEKFTPQISTYTFYGTDRDMKKAKSANLIFTTYAIMRNEIKALQEVDFFYVVLDESQNIKNINAQTTKAVMLLNAQHRLALSGTPIENNLSELYALFRFLNPTMFGTLNQFNKDYLHPIQKSNDLTAIQALRKRIYPFILRRLKKEVLKDLPDKIEQTLFVDMSEAQQKLYEQRRQFYQLAIQQQIATQGIQQSRFFVFQALNELRQIATVPENINAQIASPKVELLMEQLQDTIANGHKALVFVNFLAAIELIGNQLDDIGIDYVSMTGATRDRQTLVNRFQQDQQCKVFLMTLKTGGTGLNLTAADTIFIFDPWWNLAAENQAIDRAHRIGQQNKVLAYRLITSGTIEEKIMQLQQLKKELFDQVIGSDATSLKSLTVEDIDYILG